jgi:N6-adenosine-specific RNA methylase IME4
VYFKTIVADPPWHFRLFSEKTGTGRAPQRHYHCMTLDDIKKLPVREVSDPDGCVLFLWATNPILPAALSVMSAWGYTFVTKLEWVKMTKDNQKPRLGTGYRLRGCTEPLLIGVYGRNPYCPPRSEVLPGVILSPRREHSRKPDESFRYFEQYPVPRLEMFSREQREGWTCLGDGIDGMDIRESLARLANQTTLPIVAGGAADN